jgi:DNA mismatch repair protein MutS
MSTKKKEDLTYIRCLDLQTEFEEKYGPKTVVLAQVGAFYEIYGIHDYVNDIKEGKAYEISKVLNMTVAHKSNKVNDDDDSDNEEKKDTETKTRWLVMAGFPDFQLDRHVPILLDTNYTVVLYEQTGDIVHTTKTGKKNITKKREITNILTPGTYIEETNKLDSPGIGSLYIQRNTDFKSRNKVITLGMSYIDSSTGCSWLYEVTMMESEKRYLHDELSKWVNNFKPQEWIINTDLDQTDLLKEFKNTLEFEQTKNYFMTYDDKTLQKVSYMEEFFNNIFDHKSLINSIEYIGLERNQITLYSYLMLLRFVNERNPQIIKNIAKPKWWKQTRYMSLYNQAYYQLQVIPFNTNAHRNKINSLFDVLNMSSTSMGRRLLRFRILNPLVNVEEIETRYQYIEMFLENNIYKEFEYILKEVVDIERLHRRIVVHLLHPSEFTQLHNSYGSIQQLLCKLRDKNISMPFDIDDMINNLQNYMNHYNSYFNINKMFKCNLNSIVNFFKKEVSEEVDVICQTIEESKQQLDEEREKIIELFLENFEDGKIDINGKMFTIQQFFSVDRTDKEGYSIKANKNCIDVSKLKKTIENEGYVIKAKNKSNYKITSKTIDNISKRLVGYNEQKKNIVRHEYMKILDTFATQYNDLWSELVNIISDIDFYICGAKVADMYGYCKPNIDNKMENKSYVDAKQIRHPIIERIQENILYVANDIMLGQEPSIGMLVYGVNGVGKSSMGKSVGISIIMAQMGFFVPCTEFNYYPFNKLYTRITSEDDIFQGYSSFIVEMNDLRSIFEGSDENTIVIGDEICRGTEHISGTAIVSTTIDRFIKRHIPFILATHQHTLTDIEIVNKHIDNGLSIKHLDINFDEETGAFVYERKLQDGKGRELYGVEIAKHVINDDSFYHDALSVRRNLTNEPSDIVIPKQSRYNTDIFMHSCQICGRNELETDLDAHHIVFQEKFKGNARLGSLRKNQCGNLVVLCKEHHNMVHSDELTIEGYEQTSDGKKLRYYFNKKQNIDHNISQNTKPIHESSTDTEQEIFNDIDIVSNVTITPSPPPKRNGRKKYSEEDITIILTYKTQFESNGIKSTISLLKDIGYKIGSTTLKKIMNNEY